jgi:hypothetical protein
VRASESTLLIDAGSSAMAAVAANEHGWWLVPDPNTGESRWPSAGLRDGQRMVDLFRALRAQAQRQLATISQGGVLAGPVRRAVITIPASVAAADPRRARLVSAAEVAGFAAVELLAAPAAAVWTPGSPLRVGDVALVYDLGTTFEAAVVRVGDDLPEVLGHASLVDWPMEVLNRAPGAPWAAYSPAAVDLTISCCQDLLARLGLGRGVSAVLAVGGGARTAGLAAMLEHGLGLPVVQFDEPELAVIRGAAVWWPRSGPRTVPARPIDDRMVPLIFTIPGGSARLVRWLVEPQQFYEEGAPVARIRLAGGDVWELVSRGRGTVDQVLVPTGQQVHTGEWLALVRPR